MHYELYSKILPLSLTQYHFCLSNIHLLNRKTEEEKRKVYLFSINTIQKQVKSLLFKEPVA